MTDTDQRSLISILTGLATLLHHTDDPHCQEIAMAMDAQACKVAALLNEKLAKPRDRAELKAAVIASAKRLWPDDVEAACKRAGREEEP
jgi:hypothetical protein